MWTPVVVPSSAGTSHHAPWPEDALTGSVLRPRTVFGTGCFRDKSTSYDRAIGTQTHYDVLGVAPDADQAQIRAAYVGRARERHPDAAAASRVPGAPAGDGPTMAELNHAYEVLRRPDTRRSYDRSLLAGAAHDDSPPAAPDEWLDDDEVDATPSPGARLAGRVLTPSGPARMPWRLMAVAAIVGSAIVLISAALADPPSEESPDGILQVGSCVAIESNGDAREVACSVSSAMVVRRLLPTGSTCPPAYGTHRDRLGLGTVCIESVG